MKKALLLLTFVQAVLALPVIARLVRTGGGKRIERRETSTARNERVSVIVPVLNEAARLAPCLDGLTAQGEEVAEILVVDGGSTDGTQELIQWYGRRDGRVRLVDATPVPSVGNGKAHGLAVGYASSRQDLPWVLTVDADVRPEPELVLALLAHAETERIEALSAATRQRVSGAAEAMVHPAMLTTLVYRYGIPGHATTSIGRVQANGQCFLVRGRLLDKVGGFAAVADSICEDVTLARTIAASNHRVGFYETDDLVAVEMYGNWRDAWDNWTRSLPMRDRYTQRAWNHGLAEVLLVQALPLWLLPLLAKTFGPGHPAVTINVALVCTRFGVLAGTARAYDERPWTYWLSPLCDLPVAFRLLTMARRRTHVWRGRTLTLGGTA